MRYLLFVILLAIMGWLAMGCSSDHTFTVDGEIDLNQNGGGGGGQPISTWWIYVDGFYYDEFTMPPSFMPDPGDMIELDFVDYEVDEVLTGDLYNTLMLVTP